jgi:hypothetical protein
LLCAARISAIRHFVSWPAASTATASQAFAGQLWEGPEWPAPGRVGCRRCGGSSWHAHTAPHEEGLVGHGGVGSLGLRCQSQALSTGKDVGMSRTLAHSTLHVYFSYISMAFLLLLLMFLSPPLRVAGPMALSMVERNGIIYNRRLAFTQHLHVTYIRTG